MFLRSLPDGYADMIVYDLECANNHTFEGWFEDRKAYEAQRRRKLIVCPVCSDTSVVTVPSTFGIKGRSAVSEKETQKADDGAVLQKALEFLEKNFENVGSDFAQEALKMHYDVTEKRNIRGTSTEAEEDMLREEDIEFFKIPVPRLDS
jgi:hypothetical protein